MPKKIILLLTAHLLLATYSCTRSDTAILLDNAESYIIREPETALSILSRIPADSIRGKKDMARHALLHSIALDKNYVDITDDSLINIAVRWYRKHGTPDDKLKAYYYQGRVYQNAGDNERAMESFLKAEKYAGKAEDHTQIGLLHVGKARIYDGLYDFNACLENLQSAAGHYMEAKDTNKYIGALCDIANKHLILKQYDRCDSVLAEIRKFWNNARTTKKSSYFHTLIFLNQNYRSKESALAATEEYIHEIPPQNIMWISVADILLMNGRITDAAKALENYKIYGGDCDGNPAWHDSLGNIYKAQGNFEMALYEKEMYAGLSDSSGMDIIMDQTHTVIEKMKAEMILMKRNMFIISLGFSMILLAIMATWAIRHLKKRLIRKTEEKRALEYEKVRLEKENKEIFLEKAKFEKLYSKLLKEKKSLEQIVNNNTAENESVRKLISERLSILDKFISEYISGSKTFRAASELEKLLSDRKRFLDSTRLSFALGYPGFISFLKGKELTEKEINYCCLYAIGLTGKEIGNYLNVKGHYNVNSAIRHKLGLGGHDQNLKNYLQKIIKDDIR